MVVGYTDVNDGCTDGSADRITDPEDKEDALKIELKDYGTITGPEEKTRNVQNDVPQKILDICSRTTADKDRIVETTVDVVSSSDESTDECDSSSEDDNNALDTVGNNQNNQMVNKMTDCKDFLVANRVQIINNYQQQHLDVEQLKYITDGNTSPKSLWTDGIHSDESIERAHKQVSYPFGKAVSIAVTVILVLVVIVVGIEIWQLKSPEAEGNPDSQYDNDVTIFGPSAPPNVTLVPRQVCALKDPAVYNMDNLTVMTPPFVIITHTVTAECFTRNECCERMRNIQSDHLAKGWTDIGYHFLVGGDGRVYEGRQWNKYGSFLIGFNCMSYGVSFIGNFVVETPRHKQVLAAEKLLDELEAFGYLSKNYTVYGAKQIQATDSPGVKIMEEIQKWPHWSSDVENSQPCPTLTKP